MINIAKTEGLINLGTSGLENIEQVTGGATEQGQVLTNTLLGEMVRLLSGAIAPTEPAQSTNLGGDKPESSTMIPGIEIPDSGLSDLRNQLNLIPSTEGNSWIKNDTFDLRKELKPVQPVFNNKVSTDVSSPMVAIHNKPPSTPLYYLNSLASELKPSAIDYRLPPGVQQNMQPSDFGRSRVVNVTNNITNQIDANSQRQMYNKIGEVQTKAIVDSLKSSLV